MPLSEARTTESFSSILVATVRVHRNRELGPFNLHVDANSLVERDTSKTELAQHSLAHTERTSPDSMNVRDWETPFRTLMPVIPNGQLC
jgi:hypothetical protein